MLAKAGDTDTMRIPLPDAATSRQMFWRAVAGAAEALVFAGPAGEYFDATELVVHHGLALFQTACLLKNAPAATKSEPSLIRLNG